MHLSGHTLYWIHEGEGKFTSKEQTILVTSGTLLYASPGLQVQYTSDEKYPMEFTIIRFDCMTLDNHKDSWVAAPVEHLGLPFCMPTSNIDRLEMDGLIQSLIKRWNPTSIGGEVGTKAALSELILYASKYLVQLKRQTSSMFERIKETMQFQYHQALSIEGLARDYGISPVYLRKLFHMHEGCSPKQYLEAIRYENAVRLLLHSDLSLRTIAEVCGYSDEFHFSKVFKKTAGQAPATFKRQMSGK
jgi:AraC family transcriptional regulator